MTAAVDADPAEVLRHTLGGGTTVRQISRLSGGASLETWVATVSDDDGERRVVLRRDRPGPPSSSRVQEADVLRLMHAAGVPVPRVLAAASDDGHGPARIVMEFLDGETIPRRLLRDDEYAVARDRLTGQVGAALATVHRVPPDGLGFLPPPVTPLRAVEELAETAERLEGATRSPVFALAVRHLMATAPPERAPVVVHGDVRTGNLMVDRTGLVSVLDWELAHLGQPGEDLGWFCVRAWRFGSALEAGGFGTRDELLDAYAAAGGRPVHRTELDFWELFGTLRWGVTCLSQVAAHLAGHVHSVELAAIGRRVAEVEYDLVHHLRRS